METISSSFDWPLFQRLLFKEDTYIPLVANTVTTVALGILLCLSLAGTVAMPPVTIVIIGVGMGVTALVALKIFLNVAIESKIEHPIEHSKEKAVLVKDKEAIIPKNFRNSISEICGELIQLDSLEVFTINNFNQNRADFFNKLDSPTIVRISQNSFCLAIPLLRGKNGENMDERAVISINYYGDAILYGDAIKSEDCQLWSASVEEAVCELKVITAVLGLKILGSLKIVEQLKPIKDILSGKVIEINSVKYKLSSLCDEKLNKGAFGGAEKPDGDNTTESNDSLSEISVHEKSNELNKDNAIGSENSNPIKITTFVPEYSPLEKIKQDYLKMDENEKENLTSLYAETFCFGCGGAMMPFADNNIKEVFNVAHQLFNPHTEKFVLALGQSPAWLLEIAKLDGKNSKGMDHIAFSGDWWGIVDNDGVEQLEDYKGRAIERTEKTKGLIITKTTILTKLKTLPTNEQIKNYQIYLERIGCTPAQIMNRNEPTVIVDYVQRAGGLRSFLDILYLCAKESGISADQLKNKLEIHFLYELVFLSNMTPEISKNDYQDYLTINFDSLASKMYFTPTTDGVVYKNSIEFLFNKTDENQRLIKRFPYNKWNLEECKNGSTYVENPIIECIYGQILKHNEWLESRKK